MSVVEEGSTRIRNRYVVSPTVAGFLQRVTVRAGDPVVAGQTLLATVQAASASFLDPRARAQAEAAVQSAEATCMQRNEQVNSAAAELDLGQRDLTRAQKLKDTGAIALQALDLAMNRVEVLEDQLASAKFALKVAEYELAQAKAALVHVEDEGDAGRLIEIRSPVTGRVLNVFEESARVVAADTPIMEVGDPKDLEVEVELLSTDAVNVKRGAEVSIQRMGRKRASFRKGHACGATRFPENLCSRRRGTARQSASEFCRSPEERSRRSIPRGGACHHVVRGRCASGTRCRVVSSRQGLDDIYGGEEQGQADEGYR